MVNTLRFEGREHKVFVVKTPYGTYPMIVAERQYGNGGLALEAISCADIGDGYLEPEDSFGILTVNLGTASKLCQFVKNYSENEGWAEELARAIGGKDTGIREQTGFVTVPFYDFSQMQIYADYPPRT